MDQNILLIFLSNIPPAALFLYALRTRNHHKRTKILLGLAIMIFTVLGILDFYSLSADGSSVRHLGATLTSLIAGPFLILSSVVFVVLGDAIRMIVASHARATKPHLSVVIGNRKIEAEDLSNAA